MLSWGGIGGGIQSTFRIKSTGVQFTVYWSQKQTEGFPNLIKNSGQMQKKKETKNVLNVHFPLAGWDVTRSMRHIQNTSPFNENTCK